MLIIYDHFLMWKVMCNFLLKRKFLERMWEIGKNDGKEGGGLSICNHLKKSMDCTLIIWIGF